MAKMNWDRVRQWDRQRGGMSDMELEDEREERWFEREADSELQRQDRQEPRPAAKQAKARPKRSRNRTKKTRKNLDLPAVAARLGVTAGEARRSDATVVQAASGLEGLMKPERTAAVARRLRITPVELRLLRRALAGNEDVLADRERLASLVRSTAAQAPAAPVSEQRDDRSPQVAPEQSSASKAAKTQKGRKPGRGEDQLVYVTTWGNVVHLFHDCHKTRGFRGPQEADPDLYRVPVQDPSCRGRRVCGGCKGSSAVSAKKVDEQLRRFHGKPFDESEWKRQGWNRPKPKGTPINRTRRR